MSTNILSLTEKLEFLDLAITFRNSLQFKYSADEKHDYALLDWFAEFGHFRVYRRYDIKCYELYLSTENGLTIRLGTISDPPMTEYCEQTTAEINDVGRVNGLKRKFEYMKYAWTKVKDRNIRYCTSHLLKTPDEVQILFQGNANYRFSNSPETEKSVTKHTKEVLNLLFSLEQMEIKKLKID